MPKRSISVGVISVLTLAAVACTGAVSPPAAAPGPAPTATSPAPPISTTEAFTPTPRPSVTSPAATPELAVAVVSKPQPEPTAVEPSVDATVPEVILLDPDERPPQGMQRGWKTDFSLHTVPYDEIMSGGPGRDGIPPIDDPRYAAVATPPEYMSAEEPVVALEINGDARAYPLAILMWHEIVNDEVGGVPVTVTYCPLCNTAITFDRRVGDRVLDFGTSGLLRKSDLVMWDRQTESWWQQISGKAIVGELVGAKLTFIPAPLISWKDFAKAYPDGQVLTRNTGYFKGYDSAPYSGYDSLDGRPFLFTGAIDPALPAMERVIGLELGGSKVAYPFPAFSDTPVLHDTVGGQDIVIFFADGTLSAFRTRSYQGNRVVGSTGVFYPSVDGRRLTFVAEDGAVVDEQTGSEWNVLGQAVGGELEGRRLEQVVHANHFWFAWQAFHPDTEIRLAEDIQG